MKERHLNKQKIESQIDVLPEWNKAIQKIMSVSCPKVMVIGHVDSGKSTFTRLLTSRFSGSSFIIEADPGQPSYGLPGTFSLYRQSELVERYFIGHVSPAKNVPDILTGVYLLSKKAIRETKDKGLVVIDTSGLVSKPLGYRLKQAKATLTGANIVLGIYKDSKTEKELENLIKTLNIKNKLGILVPSSPNAKRYSYYKRRERRNALLKKYFKDLTERKIVIGKHNLDLSIIKNEEASNKLFSFDDKSGFSLSLGACKQLERKGDKYQLKFISPLAPDKFRKIRFGHVELENA